MPIDSFDPDSVWKPFGAFSQVVVQGAGKVVHLKGQVSLDKEGVIVGERDFRLLLAGSDSRTPNGDSYLDSCMGNIAPTTRERIDVLGRCTREELVGLYCRAAAVVLPSLQEAFPMVVMEAMACGAPTIFGACGPHNEIIEDGVDGLVCDPHSPKDIANKVLSITGSLSEVKRIGVAARKKAETCFTEERLLRQTLAFYRNIQAKYRSDGR